MNHIKFITANFLFTATSTFVLEECNFTRKRCAVIFFQCSPGKVFLQVWLCNCKQTSKRPFCDGSHAQVKQIDKKAGLFDWNSSCLICCFICVADGIFCGTRLQRKEFQLSNIIHYHCQRNLIIEFILLDCFTQSVLRRIYNFRWLLSWRWFVIGWPWSIFVTSSGFIDTFRFCSKLLLQSFFSWIALFQLRWKWIGDWQRGH